MNTGLRRFDAWLREHGGDGAVATAIKAGADTIPVPFWPIRADRESDVDRAVTELYATLAYLRQAVVNKSRSVLRHRTVADRNTQEMPPDMPSAEQGALVLLERSAVVAALRDLPERQREAIVLRYSADLSEAQIAATMGISRGAVKSHTSRGMAALRTVLQAAAELPKRT